MGEDFYGLGKIQLPHRFFQHLPVFHHEGISFYLAQQAQNFCMTHPAEDDHLAAGAVLVQAGVGFPDASLQLQYHRAGAVYNLQLALPGRLVSGRRFSVGPDEDGFSFRHFLQAAYGDQAPLLKAAQFRFVVNDGSQRIKPVSHGEEILCVRDGTDHSSAEAGTGIYFYFQHDRPGLSRMANLPCSRPITHTNSSWRVIWVLSRT